MDQSLKVFVIVSIQFTFLGFKKVKINVFGEKNILGCIFIKLKCMCFRTGPGDLKKHQTFEISYTAGFLHIFKKMKEKNHFFREI